MRVFVRVIWILNYDFYCLKYLWPILNAIRYILFIFLMNWFSSISSIQIRKSLFFISKYNVYTRNQWIPRNEIFLRNSNDCKYLKLWLQQFCVHRKSKKKKTSIFSLLLISSDFLISMWRNSKRINNSAWITVLWSLSLCVFHRKMKRKYEKTTFRVCVHCAAV